MIELSELQLPTLSRGTTVAVYTNVTSDHLDRHGSLEAYRRVKRLLAELVDPAGALVLNADDPIVATYAGIEACARSPTGTARPAPAAWASRRLGRRRRRRPLLSVSPGLALGRDGRVLPIAELAIPGRHNVANAMAAVAVGLLFGLAPEAIRRAATAFTGVEHRLETVATVDGVRYVNDSWAPSPTPSRRPSARSPRRPCSSPAAATRASTCRPSRRSWRNGRPRPSSSGRAARPSSACSARRG